MAEAALPGSEQVANDEIEGDRSHDDQMFMQRTGFGQGRPLHKLLMSPFTLMDRLLTMVDREVEHARAGKPAHIICKVNGVTETRLIEAFYRASQAGVSIDLIVRGICCLRPGVPAAPAPPVGDAPGAPAGGTVAHLARCRP